LFTTQEVLQHRDIVTRTSWNTTTGQLFWASLEILFLELGCGKRIQDIPHDWVQEVATNFLIKSMLLFLLEHNLDLQHDIMFPLIPLNDEPIMTGLL